MEDGHGGDRHPYLREHNIKTYLVIPPDNFHEVTHKDWLVQCRVFCLFVLVNRGRYFAYPLLDYTIRTQILDYFGNFRRPLKATYFAFVSVFCSSMDLFLALMLLCYCLDFK